MASMNQTSLKIRNQYAIIDAVIRNEQLSRSALSKELNLSKPTISTNVDKLIEMGILLEQGFGNTTMGKKPIMLSLNSNYRLVMVVDFNQTIPMMYISDLSQRIIAQRKIENVELIRNCVIEFVEDACVSVKSIASIVISMPGFIDEKSYQRLVNPQFCQFDSATIKADLSEIFSAPIRVENDINLAAIGEQHSGFKGSSDNLLYLSIGLGVGSGLILNGLLYEGSRRAAGEIGYQSVVNFNGDVVQLEKYISISSVVKRFAEKATCENDNWMTAYGITKVEQVDYSILMQAVKDNDPVALEIFKEIAWILGTVVFNMAVVLDLDYIVLGGEMSRIDYPLLKEIQTQMDSQSEFKIRIEASKLSNACVEGALHVGVDDVISTLI